MSVETSPGPAAATIGVERSRRMRILVVDDEPDACEVFKHALARGQHEVSGEHSARSALQLIGRQDFDLVVADVVMPEMSGIELCQRMGELRPALPVVLMSGRGAMDTVIDALRAGAVDFLKKPVASEALAAAVARALSTTATRPAAETRVEGRRPSRGARQPSSLLLGTSANMLRVHELVSDLSGSLVSVLLQGESGTGKDVIARAIHDSSPVSSGPFVAINCSAMPEGLLESSLFGHARGAFTDAKQSSKGLFLEANGGTLLLDEIGELPVAMQPKLLRALQERTVRPVGGSAEVAFNCRLITATNRDLEQEVAQKRFREDLYYRLDVVRITVPPLRQRGDDILALARHFAARFASKNRRQFAFSQPFEQALRSYRWPGNVRELENCIEYAVTMARADELAVADLPSKIRSFDPKTEAAPGAQASFNGLSLSEVERHHILHALALADGNRTTAAELLGINRRTLQRRLKSFGLGEPAETPASARH